MDRSPILAYPGVPPAIAARRAKHDKDAPASPKPEIKVVRPGRASKHSGGTSMAGL